eukprot:2336856-Rhodomonas_salina.1
MPPTAARGNQKRALNQCRASPLANAHGLGYLLRGCGVCGARAEAGGTFLDAETPSTLGSARKMIPLVSYATSVPGILSGTRRVHSRGSKVQGLASRV